MYFVKLNKILNGVFLISENQNVINMYKHVRDGLRDMTANGLLSGETSEKSTSVSRLDNNENDFRDRR